MKNSEPLYGVKFAVDSFANAAFKASWLLGVAVSEGDDTAKAMARDLDVFRKHYQWVPDDALTFYKLHAEVDQEHGLLRKEILKKYADTKELQEACINAQLMKNSMRWVDGRLHLHGVRRPRHEVEYQRRRSGVVFYHVL